MRCPSAISRGCGLVFLSLIACSAGSGEESQSVGHSVVVREATSGFASARRLAIRDTETWQRVWEEIHANSSELPPLPVVDFDQEMLILAAIGERRSSGYSVQIEQIDLDDGQIEVEVRERCPPKGSRVGMMLSQPLEVVRCRRVEGNVVFRETRDKSCDKP